MRTTCPDCEASFELPGRQARVGTLFPCPECETELEVLTENPLEVGMVLDELPDEWFYEVEDEE
ncbi:MAG TPA: hypothetical protein VER55_03805 [Ardenticatenaceae bacterium]|nr:hypothetical protein [Ardenticatenaceae bacterium]